MVSSAELPSSLRLAFASAFEDRLKAALTLRISVIGVRAVLVFSNVAMPPVALEHLDLRLGYELYLALNVGALSRHEKTRDNTSAVIEGLQREHGLLERVDFLPESGFPVRRISDSNSMLELGASMDDATLFGRHS